MLVYGGLNRRGRHIEVHQLKGCPETNAIKPGCKYRGEGGREGRGGEGGREGRGGRRKEGMQVGKDKAKKRLTSVALQWRSSADGVQS